MPKIARLTVAALAGLLLAACGPAPERSDAEDSGGARPPALEAPVEALPTTAPWSYVSTAITGQSRPQRAATLRNLRPDADDPGSFVVVPTVQLVLRDDPRWGESVYLVIEEGHFDCGEPCAFQLRFDDGEAGRWAGRTASTGTRPALFIEAAAAFIAALEGVRYLEIAPLAGGSAPIVFAVGGFSKARYRAGA